MVINNDDIAYLDDEDDQSILMKMTMKMNMTSFGRSIIENDNENEYDKY